MTMPPSSMGGPALKNDRHSFQLVNQQNQAQ